MMWAEATMDPLTKRQCEVLQLVALGYSAKEIATQIGIAPRTVEGHIEMVRLKMRARNKAHMVAQALVSGQLAMPSQAPGGIAVDHG